MAIDIGHEILADLLTNYPGWRGVLGEFGIDGSNGADITLAAAADRAGVDLTIVIEAMTGGRRIGIDCGAADRAPLGALIRHIEDIHHEFLRREFPRIDRLIQERRRSGSAPDWLSQLDEVFGELQRDMEPHLLFEETVLFPLCRDIVDASSWPSFHIGPIEEPIRKLRHDHTRAGEFLGQLDRLFSGDAGIPVATDDEPDTAAIVAAVGHLNEDLSRHLVEEDEMLFPRVLELAAALDEG